MEEQTWPGPPPPPMHALPPLAERDYAPRPRRRRLVLPLVLFLATCLSTFWTGSTGWKPLERLDSIDRAGRVLVDRWDQGQPGAGLTGAASLLLHGWRQGLLYMAAVIGILLTHEMGHFLTAQRERIPATLPFFIPVPFLPFGTMGAVIGMQGSNANRRQIFDLGLAGPLAGLAIALPVIWLGVRWLPAAPPSGDGEFLANPLIVQWMIGYFRPDFPNPEGLYLSQFNPLLMAGWVGMLVTGVNMLPVSQLDGGHVIYGLLGRRANYLARTLLIAAIVFIIVAEQYNWVLMVVVVTLLGVDHPPTANDHVPLGWPRRLLGFASLAIPILCVPPLTMPAP